MPKQYSFTSEGIEAFADDVIGDVMDAIHETGTYNDKLQITVGSRTIIIPMVSETYEALASMLHNAVTIWESEYEGEKENEDE